MEDIRLRDPWSEINLKYYSMSYANARSFSKYVREVMMEGVISRSRLTLHSLSFFANSAMRNYSTHILTPGWIIPAESLRMPGTVK
mgnify:CR=1 FL=1